MEDISGQSASLPEELLVEILARVPYRSLCRFRCVSSSWRALCSDPGLVRRAPRTLSGFFCYTRGDFRDDNLREETQYFLNFPNRSGQRTLVDPSLPFLRGGGYTHGFILVDCCGGLLLCGCFTSPTPHREVDYLVCNPATEEWIVLPRTEELHLGNTIHLGYDPADPSRFVVFVFRSDLVEVTGVEIYSSQTRTWTSKQCEWAEETSFGLYVEPTSVFLNGTLHLTTDCFSGSPVVTVDMDGNTWREIQRPFLHQGCIGQSQRRLHAMQIANYYDNGFLLSVWVLEDHASGEWTLKHAANISELLGKRPNISEPFGSHLCKPDESYRLIAIHPDCDLIFFIDVVEEKFMSYDMESEEAQVVYDKGQYFCDCEPYLPYTPCFDECLISG